MNYERESQLSGCGFVLLAAAVVLDAVALAVAVTLVGGWWM